jgi:hypothetical protein
MTGILKVDQWKDSGDNTLMTSDGAGVLTANAGITIPSGATITNNGTASGFGKIGQVVFSPFNTGNVQTTSNSWVATGHIASITPSSTSSKILVSLNMGDGYMSETTGNLGVRIHSNASGSYVDVSNNGFRLRSSPNAINTGGGSLMIVDSPNTTSSFSYQAFFNYDGSGTAVYYHNSSSFQTTMTLMEILA